MHSQIHFEYPEMCYPEEMSKVPKVPDNQGLTVYFNRQETHFGTKGGWTFRFTCSEYTDVSLD